MSRPGRCSCTRVECCKKDVRVQPPRLPSAHVLGSLSSELVSLLHGLVEETGPPGAGSPGRRGNGLGPFCSEWREEVIIVVRRWLPRAGPVVKSLQRRKVLEEQHLWEEAARARSQQAGDPEGAAAAVAAVRSNGHANEGTELDAADHGGVEDGDVGQREVNVDDPAGQTAEGGSPPLRGAALGAFSAGDLDCVVAVLCLLGGQFEDLYPGARVLCRLPLKENVTDSPDGWEDSPTAEATVLRLGLAGANLPRVDVERRSKDISSSGDPLVDGVFACGGDRVENAQARQQHQQLAQVRAARPVFAASLVPRRHGRTRPEDFYEGLSDEAYASGLAAAVVAREFFRADRERLQQQQQQLELELEREHQSVSARLERSRLRSVSCGHGRDGGFSSVRREPHTPLVGESSELLPRADDGGNGGGDTATVAPTSKQLVVLGALRHSRGSAAPRTVTVPVDSVTLLRKEVPQALIKTLTPYVEEFLPGLEAVLEAETVFQGRFQWRMRNFPRLYGKCEALRMSLSRAHSLKGPAQVVCRAVFLPFAKC